ncbi:MAG: DUF4080 domain-containing protein [Ghiorsea sp.]
MKANNIILTTLNARFTHTAIGLRYLYANMQELADDTCIREFTINDQIQDVAEQLLADQPSIIGIGVYIWNAIACAALVETLKKVSPDTTVILGGPEVSYLPMRVNFELADYIVQGEGDVAFYQLCKAIKGNLAPTERIIQASQVDVSSIRLPYDDYTDEDIAHRYIYVEASRGCPFKCEFCLSSIDDKVRNFDLDDFLAALEKLWQRGARSFKFIDRTFNLNINIAGRLLDFFLSKPTPYFVHFEVIPDHFPEALKSKMRQFSPASLQLEIGIQTLNPDVAKLIHRNLKLPKIKENITFLEQQTSAHMHLDLIVGLPSESLSSFGESLNQLCAMTDSEIQIGILKKLAGTTLHRHDEDYGMIYSDIPPYDILKNDLLSFQEIQNMKRFARFWGLYNNSGNFKQSMRLLCADADVFQQFYDFSLWVYAQTNSTWKISLDRLALLLFQYLTQTQHHEQKSTAETMIQDIMKLEGRKMPNFLKPYAYDQQDKPKRDATGHNKRQLRHL